MKISFKALGGFLGALGAKFLTTPTKRFRFGIDVSRHNGVIDWKKVKEQNCQVDFAYIKASEGQDFIDIKFIRNATEAKKVGIQVGYYHFASLNNSNVLHDAHEEAKDFIDTMKLAPKADLPPVLDLETNKIGLSKEQVLKWVNEFIETMNENGYPDVVLYSYTPFLDANLPRNHNLGNLKLWIAGYVAPERLKIPFGWDKYWIWQYSATGRIIGITSTKPVDVDLNTTKPLTDIRFDKIFY